MAEHLAQSSYLTDNRSGLLPRGSARSRIHPWHVGSFWIRGQTHVSCIGGRFFTTEPTGKPQACSFNV